MNFRQLTTGRPAARLLINPRYRRLLRQAGLVRVGEFLALPAVIVCGHRHRHVARLTVGNGAAAVGAYLKREFRVPWKVYWSSAWAGFGWVTRSYREALTLRALRRAGLPCPDWIAAGEDENGQAFLLVRELPDARELREVLRDLRTDTAGRRRLARRLGETLARLHDLGFHHADLHSKHVLVGPGDKVYFLDWQRSRQRRRLSRKHRLSDLAALDATLDDSLVSPRDRLACLRSYLRAAAPPQPQQDRGRGRRFAAVVTSVCAQAVRLLRKRYIREVRQAALPIGRQNLVWLDGERLCVTREFQAALGGEAPTWLAPAQQGRPRNGLTRETLDVPGSRRAVLVRRGMCRPLLWLWQRLRGRPFTSPELRQAAALFRLQRYGIHTPRLLAVGQRFPRPWQSESFLLTEPAPYDERLPEWLARQARGSDRRHYRQVLRESGSVLRRFHDAGCYFGNELDAPGSSLAVRRCSERSPVVVVRSVDGIRVRRRPRRALAVHDLAVWRRLLADNTGGRTDVLRFCLGYLGQDRLTPASKKLFRWLLCRRGG